MGDVTLSSIVGHPRRRSFVCTTSGTYNIPTWAQGGKGVVYVTGCGGGASGSVAATSGQRGNGGGSGGYADRCRIHIPAGVTTIAVVIGAGGAAVSGTTALAGNHGSATTITIGNVLVTLLGGDSGLNTIGQRGAFIGSAAGVVTHQAQYLASITSNGTPSASGAVFNLVAGQHGGNGTSTFGGFGAGGASPFGGFGSAVAAGPTVSTDGEDATGYGAGGSGALSLGGVSATSGAGAPGIVYLDFEEGF